MKGATNNPAPALEDLDLEMEALLQGLGPPFNKPHQLVRQGDDVLVAIASVEELDAALAEAPPFKGVLRGYVLPTTPIKDCLLLMAAAEAGCYVYGGGGAMRSFKFCLTDDGHAVVDAKIGCRAFVDQARAELGNVVSVLSSFAGDFTRAGEVEGTPFVGTVESTRREVLQGVESTVAQIKALSERLDSV